MPVIQGRRYEYERATAADVAAEGDVEMGWGRVGVGNDEGCGAGCGVGAVAVFEAWRRTLRTSRGLPMMMPMAPEIYPAQKSADIVGSGLGAPEVAWLVERDMKRDVFEPLCGLPGGILVGQAALPLYAALLIRGGSGSRDSDRCW